MRPVCPSPRTTQAQPHPPALSLLRDHKISKKNSSQRALHRPRPHPRRRERNPGLRANRARMLSPPALQPRTRTGRGTRETRRKHLHHRRRGQPRFSLGLWPFMSKRFSFWGFADYFRCHSILRGRVVKQWLSFGVPRGHRDVTLRRAKRCGLSASLVHLHKSASNPVFFWWVSLLILRTTHTFLILPCIPSRS